MRILVDCIPYDSGKSGISVYVRETVRALKAQGHELTLLCEPGVTIDASLPTIHAPRWTQKAVFSMAWHLAIFPFWLLFKRKKYEGLVICAANRRVCAFYPVATTATIHDLANFHIPGKYSRSRMLYLAYVLPFFAKRAHHLVAVSGSTKKDMVDFWHCADEDVTVLYNGVEQPESRASGNGGGEGSILYISRIEHPGKNHVRLIEAYGKLERALAEAHPLVLAGADWKDAQAVHDAAASSPHKDFIKFTGFADDLEKLWREAAFYVFPSLFEGFGLSLVEAMQRAIPCACSANGSLGEIGEGVAVTFDPYDVSSIKNALETLLNEGEEARRARIEKGFERAAKFSWADHAKGLVKLLSNVTMFKIPVARCTQNEAVDEIIALAEQRKAGKREQAAFVATLNVDFVSNAVELWPFKGNAELWKYLQGADYVTADGMPIVALSRLMGQGLPERATGADMVPLLCRKAAALGLSVYVLGGDDATIKDAFAKLGIENIKIAGIDDAFVRLDEEQPEIIERINAARPDILFVALGNPKQEIWMGRNAAKLSSGVVIGIGGTFNFLAGKVKRAPRWMQRSGLEWIYRISQEPGRLWKRYAYGLVKYSYLSIGQLIGIRRFKAAKEVE